MTFSERIKALRKSRGMSQADLAKAINLTTGSVAMWETDKRKPSFEVLEVLSEYFDKRIEYILGNSDDDTSPRLTEDQINQLAEWDEIEEYEDIFRRFAVLDSYGQAAVDAVLRAEFKRCMETGTLQQGRTINVSIKEKKASTSDASE